MIDIDLKAIQRRVEYDTYGGLKPYRMGQTAEQYAQDYTDNPQDYVPPPAPEEAIAPKFEGDWFTPVFRQNQATSWLESKFKYAPLLLQGGDGNAPIIKKEELQKRYGDAVGFNFSRDMSEARAKIIADDYKQQVEDARIASNFSGDSTLNKINFSAPTILANVPSALAEEAIVWGAAALLAPATGGLSLAGAGAVTLAHSVSLASKLQKVATTARRVLDVSSDVYKTGSKGSQVIKTLAHSTLIENGVGSALTTVNELKQGASYKNAIEMGVTQFGVGLVANPAVRFAGIGLEKGVGKVIDIYKGSRVDESIHPVKMLSDVLDEVKTEAEASNASFARNTLEGTNLERSAKELEGVYSDVVMEDLGGMLDVVSRSDNLDMDFSKPIIKSADETLGDVVDNASVRVEEPTVTGKESQAPKLTDYESLASKGQALIDKGGKVNKIGNQINKLALQYQDRELAIRSIMRGMEQSEKAGEYNMADFQTMFAIKGNKPVTIEQILDAPVDPNKTINLKETGEHLGELSTSTQELTQNIELVASKHSNPDVAKQKLLLGASSSIDPEKINLEQAGDALGVKKTESFYGDIVKPDPLANVDIKPSTVGRMIEDEEASTYSVRQAEKLDGKHGAVAKKESLDEAIESDIDVKKEIQSRLETPPLEGYVVRAFDNDGNAYDLEYRVVEMDELIPSNTRDLKANPAYPSELQPRDRSREASREQITTIANKLIPERLAESSTISDGSPIVGSDMVVESGNGRTLALQVAYDSVPQKATEYKNYLVNNASKYGISPEAVNGLKQPVLVRVNQSGTDRVAFTKKANESNLASMSVLEQAKTDASKLSSDILQVLDPNTAGDINIEFIRDFVNEVVPANERGAIVTAEGQLTAVGLKRIENAVVAKAIDAPEGQRAISNMLDSVEESSKNLGKAIVGASPTIVSMRGMIEQGIRKPLDISGDIGVVTSKLLDLKAKNTKLDEYYAQGSLFDDGLTLTQNYLMQVFDNYKNSSKKLEVFIKDYYSKVDESGDPRQTTLFSVEDKTTAQLVKELADSLDTPIKLTDKGIDTPYKAKVEPKPEVKAPDKKLETIKKLALASKKNAYYDDPRVIDEGLNDLIRDGQAPPELLTLLRDLKEEGFDKEVASFLGDPEMNRMFKQILSCEGFDL